jgi:hypothetical protein
MSITTNAVFDDDFLDKKFDDNLIDRKLEQRMTRRQRAFWYIQGSAPDRNGKMRSFLLGPYSDSQKANEIASSKRLSAFSILELDTSDLSRASQILKARKLHSGSDITGVFDRLKHKGVGEDIL